MSRISVHQEAKQVFLTKDFAEMADNSGAALDPASGDIVITYLNQVCRANTKAEVIPDNPDFRLTKNEVTCILQYLAKAPGLPIRNKWISFLELPEGEHHFVPFQNEAMKPLANKFGSDLEGFAKIAESLDGKPIPMGDVAYSLQVLPKLPLAIALWEGDDEFPPKANVLFDGVAPSFLTTAALWVLGIEVAGRFIKEDRLGYLGTVTKQG
ncbi:MAG TPA: DUF3786 domain-containing protein [Bacillota bacterium]|nr:DUF3786 domain-containing protein [Bacillota bacterium]